MRYDQERHHRRSIRLVGYDYARAGAYFVTICTHARRGVLGDLSAGVMELSAIGRVVEACWLAIPDHFALVETDAFVVMPNHVHGILVITDDVRATGASGAPGPGPGSLGAVVGSFKAAASRRVGGPLMADGERLWQRGYYEHIIRSQRALEAIRRYIAANPWLWPSDHDNPDAPQPSRQDHCRVLAQHCGFTDEELDFIINYDIKYRKGRDGGGDSDD